MKAARHSARRPRRRVSATLRARSSSDSGPRSRTLASWPVLAAMLIIAAAPATAFAQSIDWIRQFGTAGRDRAAAIAVNASAVYVAGGTEATLPGQRSAGAVDAFVARYD